MRLLMAVLFVISAAALLAAGPSPAGDQGYFLNAATFDEKKDPPKGDEPKKNPDETDPITIKGKIAKDDPFDPKMQQNQNKNCHHKVHTVKMMAGFQYIIDMKADKKKDSEDATFDTWLRLEDSTGKELAENDDYISTDSRIVFTPDKADDFRIICTTCDANFTGAYTLSVMGYKAGSKKKGDAVVILNLNAALTKDDPTDEVRMGNHTKVHVFKMLPGKTYQIDMISNQFDSYLRLEDSKAKQLAEDDDSGGNLNAQIIFTPTKVDDYRIIATTFGPGATGMYQLKVTLK